MPGAVEILGNPYKVSAFPLIYGQVNKTTGTIPNCNILCCVVDGSVTLITHGETIPCVAGDVFTFGLQSVTIVSGTFHLA